jgi:hypothetical protein
MVKASERYRLARDDDGETHEDALDIVASDSAANECAAIVVWLRARARISFSPARYAALITAAERIEKGDHWA